MLGKKLPPLQLRDRQLEITGLRRQDTITVSVTFGHTLIGSFVAAGADRLGGLDLDQLLRQVLGQLAHQIDTAITVGERDKKFGQGRLRQSHRCVLLQVGSCGTHQGSRRWLTGRWTYESPPPHGALSCETDWETVGATTNG